MLITRSPVIEQRQLIVRHYLE